MTRPIIIDHPKLVLMELDAAGAPVGSAVDVSCDVASAELSPEQDIETVSTFCGKYRVMGDPEWSLTLGLVIGVDTSTNWAALVGSSVEVRIYDRQDSTQYRMVESEIPFDPSLGGPTDADEQVRAYDLDLPVYSEPVWVTAP
jgi:hypothetical protein